MMNKAIMSNHRTAYPVVPVRNPDWPGQGQLPPPACARMPRGPDDAQAEAVTASAANITTADTIQRIAVVFLEVLSIEEFIHVLPSNPTYEHYYKSGSLGVSLCTLIERSLQGRPGSVFESGQIMHSKGPERTVVNDRNVA
jgi:hypothetical protein